MTLINVQPLQVRIGGLVAADATVQLQCWAGDGPAVRSSGSGVIFPPVETVRLTAGVPAAPIDYPATLGTCCVKISVRSAAGVFALERYVEIPEAGPVDFDDLVDVDPSTFAPSLENITAWQAWRDAAQQLMSAAVQAAADAGLFAEATEFDAGRAGDSAFEAGKSAAIALGHKNAAKLSEDAAATSAGASSTSEGNSKTSETNAAASAAAAQAATFGGTAPAANTSLDTLTNVGVYRIGWAATIAQGAPYENFVGTIETLPRAYNAVTQIALKHNALSSDARRFYMRTQTGSGWGAWAVYASQRVDQTAGRAIYTWDDSNVREQLIYGDTGRRDITSLFGASVTAGRVLIQRYGRHVTITLDNVTVPSGAPTVVGIIPVGFRTTSAGVFPVGYSPNTATIWGDGNINLPTGSGRYGSFTYLTEQPWPTSLPGTADGSIPNA